MCKFRGLCASLGECASLGGECGGQSGVSVQVYGVSVQCKSHMP